MNRFPQKKENRSIVYFLRGILKDSFKNRLKLGSYLILMTTDN